MATNSDDERTPNLPTIHSFRTGDCILVDGDTSANMPKDDLLRETAENAVNSGLAASKESVDDIVEEMPYAVEYSSTNLDESMFSAGNIDSNGNINTATSVLHSSLIDLTGDFVKAICDSFFYRVSIAFYRNSTFISRTDYVAVNGILVAKAPVGATRFRVQFWKAAGGGDAVFSDSGIAVWQGESEYEEMASFKVVDDVDDIKSEYVPYGIDYESVSVDSSMFAYGSIGSDGVLNPNSTGVMYSDFIDVEGKDFVKAKVLVGYRVGAVFYGDSGLVYRSAYAATGQDLEEEVPKSAKYCRVQFWAYQLGVSASYSDAGIEIFTGVKNYKKSADKDSLDSLLNTRAMYAGDVPVVFEQGAIYSASGYNSQNNSSWYTRSIRSNFIRVEGLFVVGVKHTAGFSFQAYLYNSDKEYISSTDSLPTCRYLRHTGYIRISITKTDQSDLSPSDITSDDVVLPTFFKDVLDVVHGSELFMPSFNLTSESVLSYLDGLASDYSHYITEHGLLTMDSSGTKKINYYKLGTGAKKIAIVSGQHGPKSDPFDSVITLCALIRSLCKNEFSKDDFLYKLKTEYTLYIIPILNPYGIDNYNWSQEAGTIGGRNNSNGVNLNRDWADQTQIETQKAAEALEAFAPSAVIDLHATGNFPNEGSFGGQWGWLSDKAKAIAFTNIIAPAHWRDYNIESSLGYSDDMSAVSGTSLDSWSYVNLHCVGCTCECQYMIRAIPTKLHTSQVESANFSFLVNTIAINAFAASLENDYSYILTRPQKGA